MPSAVMVLPSVSPRPTIARTTGLLLDVAADAADERPVDLDLVEREAAKVAERGIARTEVVHGDARAEVAQRAERVENRVRPVEEQRFRDFEFETLRRESARLRARRGPWRTTSSAAKLHGRDVDGDAHVRGPFHRVVARAAQDEVAEARDQAGFLGDGYELDGRDIAAFGVEPTHERFGRHRMAGRERHERLVVHIRGCPFRLRDEDPASSLRRAWARAFMSASK